MFRSRPVSLTLVGLFVWTTACTSYRHIGMGEPPDHDLLLRPEATAKQEATPLGVASNAPDRKEHVRSGARWIWIDARLTPASHP